MARKSAKRHRRGIGVNAYLVNLGKKSLAKRLKIAGYPPSMEWLLSDGYYLAQSQEPWQEKRDRALELITWILSGGIKFGHKHTYFMNLGWLYGVMISSKMLNAKWKPIGRIFQYMLTEGLKRKDLKNDIKELYDMHFAAEDLKDINE